MCDQKFIQMFRADLFFAFDQELDIDWQTSCFDDGFHGIDRRHRCPFISEAPRAYKLSFRNRRLKGMTFPITQWFRRLDVIMSIDQHRGNGGAAIQPFSIYNGMSPVGSISTLFRPMERSWPASQLAALSIFSLYAGSCEIDGMRRSWISSD